MNEAASDPKGYESNIYRARQATRRLGAAALGSDVGNPYADYDDVPEFTVLLENEERHRRRRPKSPIQPGWPTGVAGSNPTAPWDF